MRADPKARVAEIEKTLTAKQVRAAHEYQIDYNGTKACERAGYSKKTSRTMWTQNMQKPSFAELVGLLAAKTLDAVDMTAEQIWEETAAVATSELRDVFTWDADGTMAFVESAALEPRVSKAIKSVKVTRTITTNEKTNTSYETVRMDIALHDKVRALELAAKMRGMLREAGDDDTEKGWRPVALLEKTPIKDKGK